MNRLLMIFSFVFLTVSWPALGQLIIEGEGVVSIEPDEFSVEIGIETHSKLVGDAWVQLTKKMDTLYDVVHEAGVDRDQFQVGTVRLRRRGSSLVGGAEIEIVVPARDDNDQLLDAIQRVPSIQIESFRYRSSRERELRNNAKALAVSSAVMQLDELARSAGGRRGAIRSINREPQSDVEEIVVTSSGVSNNSSSRRRVPVSRGKLRFTEKVWVTANFVENE